ncbi:hypothetical protein GCM10011532_17890 [Christiangramia forsetii]|nr:hypothetical protein GCM10011532_17890 [Christiangramia forsetii]
MGVAQSVTSDKDDYAPGETAIITGKGWTGDSIVNVHFNEAPVVDHIHDYHDTTVDENGNFVINFPILERHLGVAFKVEVVGATTGRKAFTYFTDGNSVVLSAGSQNGAVNSGTGGNVTFLINAQRDGAGNAFSVALTANSLPPGVTASFSPSTLNYPKQNPNIVLNSTLTLNVGSAVLAGSYQFNISPSDGDTILAILIVDGTACTVPVINVPSNIISNSAADSCGSVISYNVSTTAGTPPFSYTYSTTGATVTNSTSGTGSGSLFNVGVTNVTVTAGNSCGNDKESFAVTVTDDGPPVLTAGANQDVVLGENCSIIVPDVTGSATDNCAGTMITQLPTAGTVVTAIDGEIINVEVTATDAAGNTDTVNVILTAQDETDPVLTAAANQEVVLGENCSIVVPDVTGSATDNCAGTTITQLPTAGTIVTAIDGETINVEVTATDAAGNTDIASVVLTAQDETDPILTAGANQDVILGENCSIIVPDVTGSATDNCAGTTFTQLPTAGTVVTAIDGEIINIEVTATDAAGNTDEATVVLTAQDETDPVLTAAANQYVILGENCSIVVPDVTGSATDNCVGTTITQLPTAGTVVTAIDGETINIEVTATDAAGNTDTASVILTAQDETDPILTAGANQDVILGENCSIVVPDVTGSATDNCAGTTITQLPTAGTVVTAIDGDTINVEVTATDAAGNTDTATVVLTAQDETDPVLTAAANQDVILGENCSIVVPDVTGSATDNCAGTTITQLPIAGTVVTAIDGETINVEVTATDAAGNTDTANVILTAQDETDPVLNAGANQEVVLGENCSIIVPDVTGSATDNCEGTTITQLPTAGTVVTAIDGETINVEVTATDAAGNTDTANVILTAQDETDPVLTAGVNQDVILGENCSIVVPDVTGSATDNCAGTTITQLPTAGTVVSTIDGETVNVEVTATDAAGNTDTATVILTAQDETDPIITAGANQDVVLGENCSIIVPDVTGSATDNCAGTTITQLPTAGTVVTAIDGETIEVEVTATDAAGNTDIASVVLTAQDETDPVLTAGANQDVILGENCSIVVPDVTGSATDNCAGTTFTQLPTAGTIVTAIDGETINVGVTATDAAGNTDTATVVLTAQDETDPILTAAANQDVILGENCSIVVPDVTGSATDNCAGTTITQLPTAGTVVTAIDGETINVEVTATDAAGNTDTATVVLTAQDETDPSITCPSNQTRANDAGTCSYTVISTEFDPSFDDNCSGATASNDYNNSSTLAGAIFKEGETEVTWTVKDVAGNQTACKFKVTVTNEAPVINSLSGPVGPVQVGTEITLTAQFTDNNLESATWRLITNDAVVDIYTYSCEDCIEGNTITGSFTPEPGVYIVELEVTDSCGEIQTLQYEYIVIFDPTDGFVTGGGWIDSPVGAMGGGYADATGRANFGFNAKYKNGRNNVNEVDGHTNFQFKAGDLHFSSFEHDDMSLVISGKKATYTGYGTVNGIGNHRFRVIAIDGNTNGENAPDEFRIKIWGNNSNSVVLYDNQRGEAESSDLATSLSGGSIVIHKPKGGVKNNKNVELTEKTEVQNLEPESLEILNSLGVAPNPMSYSTEIRFSLKERVRADLVIYDFNGKLVRSLYSQVVDANEVIQVTFNRDNLMSGIYICKLSTGSGKTYEKQIIIK